MGFRQMGVLAEDDDPQGACRPFDRNRHGFVLGEGAAMMIVERLSHAIARGAKIYAEIKACGALAEAHHVTALDADSEALTRLIRETLKKAGLQPNEVGYINAHGTGTEQNIQITSSSGLSDSEIDKMVNEAQSHAADDSRKRNEVETRNTLDGLVYSTGKLVNENRDKLVGSDLSEAERALAEAKKALEEGPADRMERAYEKLTQASHQSSRQRSTRRAHPAQARRDRRPVAAPPADAHCDPAHLPLKTGPCESGERLRYKPRAGLLDLSASLLR